MSDIQYSVFTKPWREIDLAGLACHVREMGFDGVELPVRPGFQVTPEQVSVELAQASRVFADHGLVILSVAGPTDEATIAACADAGIPVIRICLSIGSEGYMATESRLQREFDALVPLLDRYGVTLGIQNHCDACVSNAMGIRHLIEKYDPRHIAAVWDVAHNALNGEEPELAIDIVWSLLCMVNLKNAFWQRTTGPEADYATWNKYWTAGRHGLASWPRVAAELKRRSYRGTVCLTAEYTDETSVDRLVREDLIFARSLLG